jgi:tetrahydromethanopterin S-methyltransferase subunit B
MTKNKLIDLQRKASALQRRTDEVNLDVQKIKENMEEIERITESIASSLKEG